MCSPNLESQLFKKLMLTVKTVNNNNNNNNYL